MKVFVKKFGKFEKIVGIVSSDAALAAPIPPKIHPHNCANSQPFARKYK